jgi:hypothetical protein
MDKVAGTDMGFDKFAEMDKVAGMDMVFAHQQV